MGLEERREEKKLFRLRLHRISEDRLVRKVVALLNDCRGWYAAYCELKRKLAIISSHAIWRNCMLDVHEEGRQEVVGGKPSPKWYRLREGLGI